MSDLIDRQDVIDMLRIHRDKEYKKSMSAECKHKSVIRSKHDAHAAFCDYLIEYVKQVPTHETPSNTLGALNCVDRAEAIKAVKFYETFCDPYPRVIEALEELPSVQPLQLTDDDKETIRIHLSAFKERLCNQGRWNEANEYEELIARFLLASSAQPRKGKWIDTTSKDHYKCSLCGTRAAYWFNEENSCEWNEDMSEWLSDFCPNCGADMRGE